MTSTRTVPAVTAPDGGRTLTPLIIVLAVTQTVGYGVLSYAFSVLLTRSPLTCTPARLRSPARSRCWFWRLPPGRSRPGGGWTATAAEP
jgi:hypothetical protein